MLYELMLRILLSLVRQVSLNPYSNGIYSMSYSASPLIRDARRVLILILMEYTL